MDMAAKYNGNRSLQSAPSLGKKVEGQDGGDRSSVLSALDPHL